MLNHKPRIDRLRRKTEGYSAYERGVTVCPYERLTVERVNWWNGWEEAQNDDIKEHEAANARDT